MLSLHKIWRGKTGLSEVPQRKNWNWKSWRGVSWGVCVLPWNWRVTQHTQPSSNTPHALSLEAMYTENFDLFHPCRWLSGFQLLTRMKHHPEVSSDTHWPQKTATSPWLRTTVVYPCNALPQLPELDPRAQGRKAAALTYGRSSWAK